MGKGGEGGNLGNLRGQFGTRERWEGVVTCRIFLIPNTGGEVWGLFSRASPH